MTLTTEPARPAPRPGRAGRPVRPHTHTSPPRSTPGDDVPQLAENVQLLGEYAGTGYKEPQHLARRGDGTLVQLTALLHMVADNINGGGYDEIAAAVSEEYGKPVSGDNVRTLVNDKLRPLGIVTALDGSSPQTESTDPLLALKLRTQVLSPGLVRGLTKLFHPLFWPPVVLAVIAGVVAVDYWLFFVHGLAQGMRATLEQPAVFLVVMAVVVVATAFHEFGHATACSYGGAKPGGMGVGIYIVWPAFYTDVTDAYQLSRGGRLRTDLGGVYFHGIAVIAVAGVYAVTGYAPLILLCFLLQMQVLQQMLPLLRLDGYYVLADLVGVPDLFRRIGPVLRSAIPFHRTEPEVDELKGWVRVVVTLWVLLIVPLLLINLTVLALSAPRLFATGWDSGMRLLGGLSTASGTADKAWTVTQLLLLVLPFLGMSYTLTRASVRGCRGAWCWSEGSIGRRMVAMTGMGSVVALLAFAWWPDGRVQPYRRGETGTVQQQIADSTTVGEGSPLLRDRDEAQQPLDAVEPGTSPVRDRAAIAEDDESTSGTPAVAPSVDPSPTATDLPSSEPSTDPSSDVVSDEPTPDVTDTPTASPSP